MICPRCGGQIIGNRCGTCGSVYGKPAKPKGLMVLSIVLAAVIAVCATVFFVLPAKSADAGVMAKNYLTAAYYSDQVINHASSYSSYKSFKKDLDQAIGLCGTMQSGTFDFLAAVRPDFSFATVYAAEAPSGIDTDVTSVYDGGYTKGASGNIEDFLASVDKDAAIALEALKKLDSAVSADTDADDVMNAISDAQDALSSADHFSIVVGDRQVSFSGITVLDGINAAFFGADIVISGDTLYLGTDGYTVFHCGQIASEVTVVNSEKGDGVVMETGSLNDMPDGYFTVEFNELDDKPETVVYTAAERQFFIDMLTGKTGLAFANADE